MLKGFKQAAQDPNLRSFVATPSIVRMSVCLCTSGNFGQVSGLVNVHILVFCGVNLRQEVGLQLYKRTLFDECVLLNAKICSPTGEI